MTEALPKWVLDPKSPYDIVGSLEEPWSQLFVEMYMPRNKKTIAVNVRISLSGVYGLTNMFATKFTQGTCDMGDTTMEFCTRDWRVIDYPSGAAAQCVYLEGCDDDKEMILRQWDQLQGHIFLYSISSTHSLDVALSTYALYCMKTSTPGSWNAVRSVLMIPLMSHRRKEGLFGLLPRPVVVLIVKRVWDSRIKGREGWEILLSSFKTDPQIWSYGGGKDPVFQMPSSVESTVSQAIDPIAQMRNT